MMCDPNINKYNSTQYNRETKQWLAITDAITQWKKNRALSSFKLDPQSKIANIFQFYYYYYY